MVLEGPGGVDSWLVLAGTLYRMAGPRSSTDSKCFMSPSSLVVSDVADARELDLLPMQDATRGGGLAVPPSLRGVSLPPLPLVL